MGVGLTLLKDAEREPTRTPVLIPVSAAFH